MFAVQCCCIFGWAALQGTRKDPKQTMKTLLHILWHDIHTSSVQYPVLALHKMSPSISFSFLEGRLPREGFRESDDSENDKSMNMSYREDPRKINLYMPDNCLIFQEFVEFSLSFFPIHLQFFLEPKKGLRLPSFFLWMFSYSSILIH